MWQLKLGWCELYVWDRRAQDSSIFILPVPNLGLLGQNTIETTLGSAAYNNYTLPWQLNQEWS